VFNIVTGDAQAIGGQLSTHPLVRKLSFTGSTPIGRLLMGQCASTIKKVSLELGGNAPFIVFDDADLDAAVEGHSGQIPQCRPDLCLRQPLLCSPVGLCQFSGALLRTRRRIAGGKRFCRGKRDRPIDFCPSCQQGASAAGRRYSVEPAC
jgi:hypothetical protein